jgi:4-hydroxymandelate oxidase
MDLAQLERQARGKLEPGAYAYFAGGTDDEVTAAANPAAWRRLRLRPHVLRDVGEVSTATTLLGTPVSLPVMVAPMARQRLGHPDGELATQRGAAGSGALAVLSTHATASIEEVAAVAPDAPRWFQLYVHRDHSLAEGLVARAAAAGYGAVVLTVDLAVPPNRERELRTPLELPEGVGLANLPPLAGEDVRERVGSNFDPSLTLQTIDWLRGLSELPLVVKGMLRGDDAAACVEHGAAAVVVSNHGGRQLDSAVSTAEALPEVVAAVAGRAEVYVDGGIRRGTDVVKALALGARAVLVGRPILWGLTCGGAAGVRDVLEGYREELERDLALCGVPTLDQLSADLVAMPGRLGT